MKNKLISALIPAYNEEECLHELYKRVTAVLSKLENYDRSEERRVGKECRL